MINVQKMQIDFLNVLAEKHKRSGNIILMYWPITWGESGWTRIVSRYSPSLFALQSACWFILPSSSAAWAVLKESLWRMTQNHTYEDGFRS